MWLPMALLSVHVSAVVNDSMPLVPWFSGAVGSATGLSVGLSVAAIQEPRGILQALQIAKLRADEMCLNAVPWLTYAHVPYSANEMSFRGREPIVFRVRTI